MAGSLELLLLPVAKSTLQAIASVTGAIKGKLLVAVPVSERSGPAQSTHYCVGPSLVAGVIGITPS
jgi:hypothetical protein